MNIFRLFGDFSHLAAILILLYKIWSTRSCAGKIILLSMVTKRRTNFSLDTFVGLSGKSVALYAVVFTCRYLDLFFTFISIYNSVMKVIYLVATYGTIYLIYRKFRSTYDSNHDTFRVELLILPAAVLAFIWNHELTILEVKLDTIES